MCIVSIYTTSSYESTSGMCRGAGSIYRIINTTFKLVVIWFYPVYEIVDTRVETTPIGDIVFKNLWGGGVGPCPLN